jgi:ABC-2 type transport system ATP-binding protein
LAQALLHDPDLVFLDEPTSGLDPLGRILVRDLIEELRRRGKTVFLSSHLLGDVEAICDRVAFLKQGRAVHELDLAAARTELEVQIRLDRVEPATVAALEAFGKVARTERNSIYMRVAGQESLPEIARVVIEKGARLYELASRYKSLEEWFVEVMGDDQLPG